VIAMMRAILLFWLSAYRTVVSPFLPRACRFYPSCSSYTEQAIRKYGILKGIAFGFGRIGRCHPWHPGGYDPIE
jgi:putative membrane protein insertion efficiency factor